MAQTREKSDKNLFSKKIKSLKNENPDEYQVYAFFEHLINVEFDEMSEDLKKNLKKQITQKMNEIIPPKEK
jgi:hypothetical protein